MDRHLRTLIAFPCAGETLLGTLDAGTARTGILIVSGGNEVRAGAHRGMTILAARLAARGHPVFRFDRRGIGDSTGENRGYANSAEDIAAAAATFRAHAALTNLIGFGNCDAASALALHGRAAGLDAVILANPWVVEPRDDLPPPAAIRARYAERLQSPAEWRRLLTGGVSLPKLIRGLRRTLDTKPAPRADRILPAIATWRDAATIILATQDATATAYTAAARARAPVKTTRIETASHSFASEADAAALEEAIVGVLQSPERDTRPSC